MPRLPTNSEGLSKKLRVFGVLVVLLVSFPAMGQHYTFSNYGVTSGLSNQSVTALLEDHTGVVWVGTQNGVFTADGARFQKQEAFSDLGMTYIRGIREDEAGRVWVVDGRHLTYWQDGKVREIKGIGLRIHGTSGVDFLCMPGQQDGIYLLHDGELWRIQTGDGGGSWRISAAFGSELLTQHAELRQLSSVVSGGGGKVWAGCAKAVCSIDLRTGIIQRFAEPEGIRAEAWTSLLRTRSGAIWARGDRTVEMLAVGATRFALVGNLPKQASLSVQSGSLVEDLAGNVLLNLALGVARSNGKEWKLFTQRDGLPKDETDILMFDHFGGLWLSSAGHGISHWLGYGNWEGWTKADGLSGDLVWAVPQDRAGNVWIASETGLDRLDPRTKRITPQGAAFPFHRMGTAVVDRRQHIWAGDTSGDMVDYDPVTQHARLLTGKLASLNELLADREGRIWACSATGLDYFMPADNWSKPHHIGEPYLPKGKVYAISETSSGLLWVTTEMGLYRFDGDTWTAVRLPFEGDEVFYNLMLAPASDGTLWVQRRTPESLLHLEVVGNTTTVLAEVKDSMLPSEGVVFMNFDHRGWLWVGSDFGVQVFNGQRWTRCMTEDGLLWDDTDSFAFTAAADGSIWIGTSGGVSHLIHPERVFDAPSPVVRLTDVRLGDKKIEAGVQARFNLRNPLLSAHLFSTNYDREGAIVYRYRLGGQENAWQDTDSNNLRFAALGPGDYTLSVAAFDRRTHQSSAVHSVAFTVLEPWWNRGWFHLVEALAAVAILIGIWWLSRHLLVARQRELESLVASRTWDLESSTSQLQQEKAELLKTRSALIEMTRRDGLTGLLNRAAIFERMTALCEASVTSGSELAIVMADLDYFKRINDEHGHVVGDTVIRECGERIRQTIRPGDFVGRYGGEELLILMPGLDSASAETRMEELRIAIAGEPIRHGAISLRVTCSFGVAWMGRERCALESLVNLADGALYQAKKNGRNRVEYAFRERAVQSAAYV